jgi:hypothetical protein
MKVFLFIVFLVSEQLLASVYPSRLTCPGSYGLHVDLKLKGTGDSYEGEIGNAPESGQPYYRNISVEKLSTGVLVFRGRETASIEMEVDPSKKYRGSLDITYPGSKTYHFTVYYCDAKP